MSMLFLPLLTACGKTFSRIKLDRDEAAAMRLALTGDIKAEVDSLASPLIEHGRTPGLVVGVLLPDGRKKIFAYGVTKRENGRRPCKDTLFATGSASKGFTAAAASLLVWEDRLSWDDTLADLLPREVPLSDDAKKITLLQLATHTSGLPRQPFTPRFAAYFMQYLFTGKNFYRHIDRNYVLDYLEGFSAPLFRDYGYSNIGYGLLGYVMERQTANDLETLVNEKIFRPLGMESTGYDRERLPGHEARARAHAGDHPKFFRRGRRVPEWEFTDVLLGAAGAYSTANDMLTFARAHLRPTEDNTLARALEDTLTVRVEREGVDRALAWAVDDVDGHKITYQIGFVSGYSCYIGMDVVNKTAVVTLQNSLNWTESIGHRLLLRMARSQK